MLGGVAGWLLGAFRARRGLLRELSDKEKEAYLAGAKAAELEERLSGAQEEARGLRDQQSMERERRVQAETRLGETKARMEEEKKLLEEAEERLTHTFKSLARDALEASGRSFHEQARKSFETLLAEARGDLGQREKAIEGLVSPLKDVLQKYEGRLSEVEKARQEAYGSLSEQLRSLNQLQKDLTQETGNLVTALKSPQVRGRWGEITLRRVVEIAGMSRHCDFTEQFTYREEGKRRRPDLVVHLPSDRMIVVDSKVSLRAYIDALEAEGDREREEALTKHARQIREQINVLGSAAYWSEMPEASDFVVMFIPGESFFSAALARDPDLIEYGVGKKVVLATPTTLITLLWSVARGWQEVRMAESAREIAGLGRDLHERLNTFARHLEKIRGALLGATRAYNDAVGSLERRVMPSARRFKDLGIGVKEDIPLLEKAEERLREPALPGFDDEESSD